jgi:toxin ParE1/3/4
MDYQVVWSPEAIEDAESIAEYIARDSEFYTEAIVTKILETTQNIKDIPLAGRAVPELGDDRVRERFVYSYRVVYRIENQAILIVAVIHGKRLFESIAARFKEQT